MKKYLILTLLALFVSCKQPGGKLETKNDTKLVDEKIDYDAILTEAGEVLYSDQTDNNKFDEISNRLEAYIPSGFSVISFGTGDANMDELQDTILIIGNNDDYSDSSLILLIKQKDGSYKLSLKDNSNLSGDNNTVKIDNGRIFIINHFNAGSEVSCFKFDNAEENWIFVEQYTAGLAGNGEITKAEEKYILGQ